MIPKNKRREVQSPHGRFAGGKLAPVMAVAVGPSEVGSLTQICEYELDPIAGRLRTEITAELISVYVPAIAADIIKNPEADHPGNVEIFREKYLSDTPVFGYEDENEITKRLSVEPISINGVKKVCEIVRLSYIAAINHLRQRKYVKATLLDNTCMTVTPALIGPTVLDRLNAVLDPDDRVNGAVHIEGRINMKGIGFTDGTLTTTAGTVNVTEGETQDGDWARTDSGEGRWIKEDPNNPGHPDVYGDLPATGLTVTDFYLAEQRDRLTRKMRKMVDDNPQYGEEQVVRYAHGLKLEVEKQPFVIYENEITLGGGMISATDGPSLGQEQTEPEDTLAFTVPIPASEFGGVVITFAVIKPDETLGSQPHPILAQPWGKINYVADELNVDPQPVMARQIRSDVAQADEETIVCYNGNNHLKKTYVNYGFSRQLDPTTVENKTAIWQLEVPASVDPDNILYPEDLDHYPFKDHSPGVEVCQYSITSIFRADTPLIFGPTPVEELAVIGDEDVFEETE
ncbi:hypothetical protein I5192_06930 [Ruegeria sp. SCSIO 43209]|nr:hypothetical protein I5192_06930 [Ruegeria sp. SCSIO 43209]